MLIIPGMDHLLERLLWTRRRSALESTVNEMLWFVIIITLIIVRHDCRSRLTSSEYMQSAL